MTKHQGKVGQNKSAIIAALPKACANQVAAVQFFEDQRWGGHGLCPRCESTAVYKMTDRKTGLRNKRFLWLCENCKKQFTVRVGTVFEDSRIPLRHWAYGFWAAAASEKGISAKQIQRMTGLSYKSALFLMHRIRFAMAEDYSGQPKLSGIVEADETYVGGKPPKDAQRGAEKGWLDRKTPVAALVERGGNIRSFVTPSVTAANVGAILLDHVSLDSHLMTDTAPIYALAGIGRPFARHGMTDHGKGEYDKLDGAHSNTVESASHY
jgi:transposase-like protein